MPVQPTSLQKVANLSSPATGTLMFALNATIATHAAHSFVPKDRADVTHLPSKRRPHANDGVRSAGSDAVDLQGWSLILTSSQEVHAFGNNAACRTDFIDPTEAITVSAGLPDDACALSFDLSG